VRGPTSIETAHLHRGDHAGTRLPLRRANAHAVAWVAAAPAERPKRLRPFRPNTSGAGCLLRIQPPYFDSQTACGQTRAYFICVFVVIYLLLSVYFICLFVYFVCCCLFYLFIHWSIYLFGSFIHSFVRSFVRSFIRSSICLFVVIYLFICLFVYLFVCCLSIYLSIHFIYLLLLHLSFIHSFLTHSLVCSPPHSSAHSFLLILHSFIHSVLFIHFIYLFILFIHLFSFLFISLICFHD
jgi:hypothetical protein